MKHQEHRHVKQPKKGRWLIVLAVIFAAIFVLAAAGFFVYHFILSKIDPVSALTLSSSSSDSVTLSWSPVENASGYHIFARKSSGEYQEMATVEGGDTLSYTLDGLDQATDYDFYITAYNLFAESADHEPLSHVYTLPEKGEITEIKPSGDTAMILSWKENPAAAGYEVQYKLSSEKDYSDDKTVTIEKGDICVATISKLSPETEYTARVLAFVKRGNEKIKGAFSDEKTVTTEKAYVASAALDADRPMIALTFDDGPGYGESGEKILDVLEKNGAKATFFMVGYNATRFSENVKRKAQLGMELGNHTWDHTHYGDEVTADDIKRCCDAIFDITGRYPTAFRSPGGMTTDAILAECSAQNMAAYYWSVDTADWESRDADAIYNHVMENAADGAIILMHEIYASTAEAVARFVPELVEKGYQLVTCRDLVYAKTGERPKAGYQYTNGFE